MGHLYHTQLPEAQGSSGERRQKDRKSHCLGMCAMRQCWSGKAMPLQM